MKIYNLTEMNNKEKGGMIYQTDVIDKKLPSMIPFDIYVTHPELTTKELEQNIHIFTLKHNIVIASLLNGNIVTNYIDIDLYKEGNHIQQQFIATGLNVLVLFTVGSMAVRVIENEDKSYQVLTPRNTETEEVFDEFIGSICPKLEEAEPRERIYAPDNVEEFKVWYEANKDLIISMDCDLSDMEIEANEDGINMVKALLTKFGFDEQMQMEGDTLVLYDVFLANVSYEIVVDLLTLLPEESLEELMIRCYKNII